MRGRCDSEEVSVGGLDNVDADVFDDFDYVALGHIHSPQSLKKGDCAPLRHAFKVFLLGGSAGKISHCGRISGKKETSRFDSPAGSGYMICAKIRGTYLEVTAKSFYQDTDTQDYVQITLTDERRISRMDYRSCGLFIPI